MRFADGSDLTQLPVNIHASAVSYFDKGVLILGASGSGKSSLALQLMAYGAELISDDLVCVSCSGGPITLCRPKKVTGLGLIEARGLGLLPAKLKNSAALNLIVDLASVQKKRLPDPQKRQIGHVSIPYVHKVDTPAFPAMILQYLKEMQNVDPTI